MKSVQMIAQWENNYTTYQIDRIQENNDITIILRDVQKHPYGVLSVFRYPLLAQESTEFPLMRWENYFRCSNYCDLTPEEVRQTENGYEPGYMAFAVQNGYKPAATFRDTTNERLVQKIYNTMPNNCSVQEYKEEHTLFISRKGKLSDFYDLNSIEKLYNLHGISGIDWQLVREYCEKEISEFADNQKSGISIERGSRGNTQHVVVGILLGYPVESTIAFINRSDCHFKPSNYRRHARMHFRRNSENYIDDAKQQWKNENGNIFIEGQQESLYY